MGLDTVELVLAFEESFGIDLPADVVEKWETPAHVIEDVTARLKESGAERLRSLVAEIVRLRTIEQLGIKPKHYREDASFVNDFGAD